MEPSYRRVCSIALLALGLAAFQWSGCDDDGDGGAADSDSDTDTDTDTDSDTDSDSSHDTQWYLQECMDYCGSQTTAQACGGYYEEPPDTADLVLKCRWVEYVATSVVPDGGCEEGDVLGRCHCTHITEVPDDDSDGSHLVPGCGELDGTPRYQEEDGKIYLAVTNGILTGSDLATCAYDLEGNATPPECSCLCDWPDDPDIECDYGQDICVDTATGLMWKATPAGYNCGYDVTASLGACDNEASGGFTDWRLPTLDELRTLIRGCPGNEADGACQLGEDCAGMDCAGADCAECSLLFGETETLCDGCACCACFDEGPCARCEEMAGPNPGGCYLPVDLDWHCHWYWSATEATPIPENQVTGYRWFVNFVEGAAGAMGDYWDDAEEQYWFTSASVACVRDLP